MFDIDPVVKAIVFFAPADGFDPTAWGQRVGEAHAENPTRWGVDRAEMLGTVYEMITAAFGDNPEGAADAFADFITGFAAFVDP